MEELLELRELVVSSNLKSALSLIDELEEMSKEDKINNISLFLLLYSSPLPRIAINWDLTSPTHALDSGIGIN
ncbi:MAG: hypothetical protein AN483_01945 [Aphanizomenon flos-aquae MDT14a]|jgi:hypothetical protein|nr:MAG: hypothetical protein AN483_01945 [Aphanizomenon flos-aquae MDT14a]